MKSVTVQPRSHDTRLARTPALRSGPEPPAGAAAVRRDDATMQTPLAPQLARAVRERAGGPLLQRFALLASDDLNYPERKRRRQGRTPKVAADDTNYFIHQYKGDDNSWFDDQGNVNLVRTAKADLLVADTGEIAIGAPSHGEAKTFWATEGVIDAGNAALHGGVTLRRKERYLLLQEPGPRLYEVQPQVRKATGGKRWGLGVRTPQNCNDMASWVGSAPKLAGQVNDDSVKVQMAIAVDGVSSQKLERKLLAFRDQAFQTIPPLAPGASEQDKAQRKAAMDAKAAAKKEYFRIEDLVVDKFMRFGRDPKKRKRMIAALHKRGINERMDPLVGEVIGIYSTGDTIDQQAADDAGVDPFPYHWGTVVARSGDDYVTLENYARRDPKVPADNTADPLYFFRMYNTRKPGQTWHSAQLATPGIIGAVPLSFRWVEPT